MPKLTERQRAFCRHLITGMSATQAAKAAGYGEAYANREAAKLVVKPHIAAEIARLRDKVEPEAIVTAQDVLRGLRNEAENAQSDTARVAAWAHLGKHLGMFTEKTEHTGGMRIEVVYVDDHPH